MELLAKTWEISATREVKQKLHFGNFNKFCLDKLSGALQPSCLSHVLCCFEKKINFISDVHSMPRSPEVNAC